MRYAIFSVLAVVTLFAAPVVARSYSLIDLANDTNVEYEDSNGQCYAANLGNIIDRFNTDYVKQSIERARDTYINTFKNYWQQWAMCIAGSLLVYGSGVSGAKSCTSDVASAAQAEAIQRVQDQYKNDLLTDCYAQSDIRGAINAARRVLTENGRDGGAVFVRDWRAFQAENRYRGLQIARNEMANTKHCPWVSSQLQTYFNYNAANASTPMNGNEDGQNSYITDAACSLPDDFNPGSERYQTTEAYAALTLPQNNIAGAYLLAQEEVRRQVAAEELAAQNEFGNGGIGAIRAIDPETGTSCAVMAADGSVCLQYSSIENPSGAVVAGVEAQQQALYDLVTNPRTTTQVANDVRQTLLASFMSMTQPLSKLQYTRGGTGTRGGATPAPTPSPTNIPGSGDPGDPLCTGGNPNCNCAINDTQSQQMARGAVLTATRAAIAQHPEMFAADGVTLLPGMNVQFLSAVCQDPALTGAGGCRPNNSGFGLVVSMEPIEINVDVILATNIIRQPGIVTLVCTSAGNL